MNAAAKILETVDTPISGVPPEVLMQVWPRAEHILKKVVKPESGHSLESVLTALQLSKMQLWVVGEFKGVVITSINVMPLHRVLWVQFLAGDNMNEWLDDWVEVQEEYARHNSCVAIEFWGRKGWKKINEMHPEYKATQTIYRRTL